MQEIASYMIAALLLVSASAVLADTQSEIQYLLQYVENSGCEFERNGSVYTSGEARSHMERKYNYVRSRVAVTEDFIRYAATESSMSGSKYHVTCDGKRQTSAEWLNNELARYRTDNAGAARLD